MVFFATSQALDTWAIVSGIYNLASDVNNNNILLYRIVVQLHIQDP